MVTASSEVVDVRDHPEAALSGFEDDHNCESAHRAGTPLTTTPGGTSRTTQAPAPTVDPSPTVRPCRIAAVVPMSTPLPTRHSPETAASGLTDTKSPSTQS